ncbi:hypothetical protein predicted by Glimmer/Critica [Acetobacter ghanensis]|uniref:Uncharacterized protein n=1 Tax=Acetobacter ghanensis TaxID=431306 RepID=A0A0U5BFF8_9PROT|nr:hypothetical protein [Acetobacter ghanensis]CEF53355.1 hypothetical protein predicted by Glimmer/Critica [Acetobacter ghanensis]
MLFPASFGITRDGMRGAWGGKKGFWAGAEAGYMGIEWNGQRAYPYDTM